MPDRRMILHQSQGLGFSFVSQQSGRRQRDPCIVESTQQQDCGDCEANEVSAERSREDAALGHVLNRETLLTARHLRKAQTPCQCRFENWSQRAACLMKSRCVTSTSRLQDGRAQNEYGA